MLVGKSFVGEKFCHFSPTFFFLDKVCDITQNLEVNYVTPIFL